MIAKIDEMGKFIWKIFFILVLLFILSIFYLIGFGIYKVANLMGGI